MPSCSLFLSPKCSKGSSGIKKHTGGKKEAALMLALLH
jgi:hypothetical protein